MNEGDIDYSLDEQNKLDLMVIREEIDLTDFDGGHPIKARVKKARQKDQVVRQKYPNADIHYLLGQQILTKKEKILDNAIGFLTDAPFGIPQMINSLQNTDKEFYLVCEKHQQFFVIVTDTYIESHRLTEKVSDKKFQKGNFLLKDCGLMPK